MTKTYLRNICCKNPESGGRATDSIMLPAYIGSSKALGRGSETLRSP